MLEESNAREKVARSAMSARPKGVDCPEIFVKMVKLGA